MGVSSKKGDKRDVCEYKGTVNSRPYVLKKFLKSSKFHYKRHPNASFNKES